MQPYETRNHNNQQRCGGYFHRTRLDDAGGDCRFVNVYGRDVRKAINAIYNEGVLSEAETMRYIRLAEQRSIDTYSIEMIIAVAYRINSRESEIFRRYIMNRLYAKKDCRIVLFANEFRKNGSIFN